MKILNLVIKERIAALAILNAFKGNLETMKVVLDDVRKFTVTKEDWEAVDRKEVVEGPNTRWEWDDKKDVGVEIVIHDDTAKYLTEEIERKSKEGKFTLADSAFVTLQEKLQ